MASNYNKNADKVDFVLEAKRIFEVEAKAILELRDRLDESLTNAIEILSECKGKIVVTGMGKSGLIGRKIASTLSSTGSPAIFVHPAESSHGDLGAVSSEDTILALSYRGETPEMNHLLQYAIRKGLKVVSITGFPKSSLGEASNVVLDVSVREEACPLGLAPTASTTAALVMGDALAMGLLIKRGFKAEDFAEFHPGGSLGRRLLTRVKDLMHSGESVPLVDKSTSMREVLYKMTSRDVRGVAGVLDSTGGLVGIVTDGDIRRRLEKSHNPIDDKAEQLMSLNPKTIDQNELAERALFVMEQFSIQVLFVVDSNGANPKQPLGMLHLQDLLKAKVR
ncbi:MAG: SIS domain-containing protein [Bdellovibrionales bacterium]